MNARDPFTRSVLPALLALAAVGCGDSSSTAALAESATPPQSNDGAPSPNEGDDSSGAARAIAEADIVQIADGRLYAMSKSGRLSIVDVSQRGRLALLGQAFLPGEPFEMYLRGHLLVVMTNGAFDVSGQANEPVRLASGGQHAGTPAPAAPPRDPNAGAGVIVIDVKDPMLMQRVATFPVPGDIADSRIVGDVLYLATYENARCFRCGASPRTLVTTFDLSTPTDMRQVDQVTFESGTQSGWGPTEWKRSIFVTAERMYVGGHADIAPNGADGLSEGVVDVLDITDPTGKLRKGAHLTTTGAIRSRWQMDEHRGVFRVVSQRGHGWAQNGIGDPELQTFHVWNSGAIQEMGKTNIQMPRQEGLKSVRFDGDRAYAITFAQTDPLFVIDLSDEANPRQRGELEMPGWVFHLEPHGDRLLGLGLDRNDPNGHLNVSLFDVADMDHPKLLSRVSFGSRSYNDDQGIVSYELPEDQDRIQKAFRVLDDGLVVVPYSGAPVLANSAAYQRCDALSGGVQLIEWHGDALVKRANLPVAGNPRRALLYQGELLAVSDSNVTSFDIARLDAPRKTADLVIDTCEAPHPASSWAMGGESAPIENDTYALACSSSSGVSKGGAFGSVALGLVCVAGLLRRRRTMESLRTED